MGWNVNNLYEYVLFLIDKYQSGNVSSNDFFYAWNGEQNKFISDLLGRWQKNNDTKTGINTGIVENERIMTILSPFTTNDSVDIEVGGNVSKPSDFLILLSMRFQGVSITNINTNQRSAVNKSIIDKADTTTNTVYRIQYKEGFNLLPPTITGVVEMDYIAKPQDVKWGFTLDIDGREKYDSGTSVQPLWDDLTLEEITRRALTGLGVRFSSQDFQQFGKSAQNTGN